MKPKAMIPAGAINCREKIARRLAKTLPAGSLSLGTTASASITNAITNVGGGGSVGVGIGASANIGAMRWNYGYNQSLPKALQLNTLMDSFGMACQLKLQSHSARISSHRQIQRQIQIQSRSMSFATLWGMLGGSSNTITEELLSEGSRSNKERGQEQEQEQLYINFENLESGHLVSAARDIRDKYESDLKALEQTIMDQKNDNGNKISINYDDLVPELARISRPIMTITNIIELYSQVMMKNDPSFTDALHEANDTVKDLTHERSNIIKHALVQLKAELVEQGTNEYDSGKVEEMRAVDELLRKQFLKGTYNPIMNTDENNKDWKTIRQQMDDTWDRLTKVYHKFLTKSSLTMEEHGKATSPQDLLQMMYEIIALQNHYAKLFGAGDNDDTSTYTYPKISMTRHNAMLTDVNDITSLHKKFGEDAGSVEKFASDEFQSAYLDLINPGSSIVDERDYFELNSVLRGLFGLCNDLFGIDVVEEKKSGKVKGWHRDVRLFHIYDESMTSTHTCTHTDDDCTKKPIGSFYLDPFRRLNKDSGCFVVPIQHVRAGVSIPTVALSMDIRPPMWDDSPQQIDVSNVVNLFHEFGHALQHMLCDVKFGEFSGAHLIETDATEVVSQFMEYWVFEGGMLEELAAHHESGEAMPVEAIEQIQQRRKASRATDLLHRLFLGQLEVEVNANFDPHGEESLVSLQRKCAERYFPHHLPPRGNIDPLVQIFQNNTRGMSTMQYRYLFSDVMSADAFEAFLDDDRDLLNRKHLRERGMKFRECFLNVGSARSTAIAFQEFRGRKASSRALLSHYGLV